MTLTLVNPALAAEKTTEIAMGAVSHEITDEVITNEVVDGVEISTWTFKEGGVDAMVKSEIYSDGHMIVTSMYDGEIIYQEETVVNNRNLLISDIIKQDSIMPMADYPITEPEWYAGTDRFSAGQTIKTVVLLAGVLAIGLGAPVDQVRKIANRVFPAIDAWAAEHDTWYSVERHYSYTAMSPSGPVYWQNRFVTTVYKDSKYSQKLAGPMSQTIETYGEPM